MINITSKDTKVSENERNKSKMKCTSIFSICILIGVIIIQVQNTEGSVLTVKNGVYKRLTVQISEAVPRQLCHRAINNIQVSRASE